jgi:hypothetical protein
LTFWLPTGSYAGLRSTTQLNVVIVNILMDYVAYVNIIAFKFVSRWPEAISPTNNGSSKPMLPMSTSWL